MTNHWVDIKNADVVVVMGGNAAEAHPVGFRWAIEAKNNNNATLIVIDPRFTRTASVADHYVPIRSGTDITFLSGVLLYLIENNKINAEYVQNYTNASLIVRDDFDFDDDYLVAITQIHVVMIKPAGTTNLMKMVMRYAMTHYKTLVVCGICFTSTCHAIHLKLLSKFVVHQRLIS